VVSEMWSPDLNPHYLWEYVKDAVYQEAPITRHTTRHDRIRRTCQAITPQIEESYGTLDTD